MPNSFQLLHQIEKGQVTDAHIDIRLDGHAQLCLYQMLVQYDPFHEKGFLMPFSDLGVHQHRIYEGIHVFGPWDNCTIAERFNSIQSEIATVVAQIFHISQEGNMFEIFKDFFPPIYSLNTLVQSSSITFTKMDPIPNCQRKRFKSGLSSLTILTLKVFEF